MPSSLDFAAWLPGAAQLALGLAALAAGGLAVGAVAWRRQRSVLQAQGRRLDLIDSLMHDMPAVTYRCAVRGQMLFISRQIEALTGWPPLAFMQQGKRFEDIVHPDDRHAVRKAFAAAGDGGEVRFDARLLHRDGHVIWTQNHGCMVTAGDGSTHVDGCIVDIGERKALEHGLAEREHLYGALLRSMPGIAFRMALDEARSFLFVSDAIQALTGWSAADFMAGSDMFRRHCHPRDLRRVQAAVADALAGDGRFAVEYRALHRDGHLFHARMQGIVVCQADGRPAWIDGAVTDISECKALEQDLQATKARGEAAAPATTALPVHTGHESRTPMTALIGLSELRLATPPDAQPRRHLQAMQATG